MLGGLGSHLILRQPFPRGLLPPAVYREQPGGGRRAGGEGGQGAGQLAGPLAQHPAACSGQRHWGWMAESGRGSVARGDRLEGGGGREARGTPGAKGGAAMHREGGIPEWRPSGVHLGKVSVRSPPLDCAGQGGPGHAGPTGGTPRSGSLGPSAAASGSAPRGPHSGDPG